MEPTPGIYYVFDIKKTGRSYHVLDQVKHFRYSITFFDIFWSMKKQIEIEYRNELWCLKTLRLVRIFEIVARKMTIHS